MRSYFPAATLDLRPPLDVIPDAFEPFPDDAWNLEMAEVALHAVKTLIPVYRAGYQGGDDIYPRDERLHAAWFGIRKARATYLDLAEFEHRLFPRLDIKRPVTLEDLADAVEAYLPGCVRYTAHYACDWISTAANKRPEGPVRDEWHCIQEMLDLAAEHWQHLPDFFIADLVCDAAHVNGHKALDLLREVYRSPIPSPATKSQVHLVGRMIVNPVDPNKLEDLEF